MPNNHRTPAQQTQTPMVPQPAQTFIQQRGQSNYGFNGGLGQHQTTNALQQQVNGTSNSLPLHLTPNPANAPSVSSTSEVGLDPNDFPALGSTSTNNNNGGGNNNGSGGSSVTTSYASQAGTGVGMGSGGSIGGTGSGATNQQRDFTPDDFPALGGQNQTQTNQEAGHSHPPGLNGFPQHSEHSQHRQNLLGTLSGGLQQSTPGMLNLGPAQARGVHPGFQHTEQEKQQQQQQQRNYNMKLNQPAHATWPSPNINPNSLAAAQNGTHPIQNPSSSHVNAPPGVPPPSANPNASSTVSATPGFPSNGLDNPSGNPSSTNPNPNNANTISNNNPQAAPPNSTQNPNSMPSSTAHVHQHPQTPAQQVLMSAADRWGLLGLLAMIKSAGSDVDQGLSSIGQDLGTMGLDMGYAGNLFSTFITPWADQSAAHTVEPDYHIPTCYNVPSSVPGPSKAQAFSDETLFFMFYSSPRDALQEVAAQELWNRNWRFHKELRLWITKDSGAPPSQKIPMGETGQYTYWDPENWMKERKDMTVLYSDLEEKNVPVFSGAGLVPTAQQQGQTVVPPQQAQPAVQTPRGSFQMVV
ncbi:not2 family protein [Moniliophthora roreri MCA 2997]|uniref:Not2 family protein n=1 Tax=Moniliophthora roreri (strain MCA 2997) TaxID=1381753 RepID=V2WPG7_MONRO|nr:not2 family protein [Moniliophthora roreri MCA 2997]